MTYNVFSETLYTTLSINQFPVSYGVCENNTIWTMFCALGQLVGDAIQIIVVG